MIARAIAAGVPFAWVVGDEVYGSDRRLRLFLEKHERPFVLAVRRNEKLWSMLAGRLGQHTATDLAAALPDAASRRGREPRASDCMTGRACAAPGYKRRPGNIGR
jgi:SRSO17 transposase